MHVANFLAIVERHAADEHIGQLGPAEFQFEMPRLFVRAAENGEIAVARACRLRTRDAISSTTVRASTVSSASCKMRGFSPSMAARKLLACRLLLKPISRLAQCDDFAR